MAQSFMKWILSFLILISSILQSAETPLFCSASWDGKQFTTDFDQPTLHFNKTIKGISIYFNSPHPTVYGHALLDGIIPLYGTIKQNDLLDKPINILVPATYDQQSHPTFQKIINLLKDIFPHANLLILRRGRLAKPLYFEQLMINDYVPRQNSTEIFYSFYQTVPESWKHIYALRNYGIQDNIVYQDPSQESNLVKEFVQHVKKIYQIQDCLVNNRVIIAYRGISRKILNLNQLVTSLQDAGYDVCAMDFEKYSIREQIQAMSQCAYLIGTYGSNLTNAVFLPPQASVMILWHKFAKYFWGRDKATIFL